MFSRFKRSLLGSHDSLETKQGENRSFHDVRDLLADFKQSSDFSSCQSEILEREKPKKKKRWTEIRSIFNSDEDVCSVRSDYPWTYNTSESQQFNFGNREGISTYKNKGRKFKEAEENLKNSNRSIENISSEKEAKEDNEIMLHRNGINPEKRNAFERDVCSAKLENEMEKYELEIMNLRQTIESLKLSSANHSTWKEETLYQKIRSFDLIVLISEEFSQDQFKNVDMRSEGFGLELRDDCGVVHLTVYDRVLELNSLDVFRITKMGWKEMKKKLTFPVQAVFMRTQYSRQEPRLMTSKGKTMTDLRSDISHIQSRLEKKFLEGKNTCTELELVVKERDSLGKENLRLLHRIAFLEDHTKELQIGLKQIQSSLEKTLKTEVLGNFSNLGMQRLPQRDVLSSVSDERCSTATSGIYSNADSEISTSPEHSTNWSLQTSEGWSIGPKICESKIGNVSNANVNKTANKSKRHVSKMPPPKPVRYHLPPSTKNLSNVRAYSHSEISKRSTQISRIPQPQKKSASYMNIHKKEDPILV